MQILGSERPKAHYFWAGVSAAILAIAFLAYLTAEQSGGSSPVGFAIGLVLAAIVLFECALYPRKLLRRYRLLGPMHLWMRIHIWLGMICVPLIFLHSGFTFGGTLSTWLAWLMILVFMSGAFGLLMQNIIPYRILDSVPEEIILSQAPEQLRQNRRLACELMLRVYREEMGEAVLASLVSASVETAEPPQGHDLRLRSMLQLEQSLLDKYDPGVELRDPAELFKAYAEIVDPYLEGDRKRNLLASRPGAMAFFTELRKRVEPNAEPIVDALQDWCRQRRQIDRQRRLNYWLHGWIPVHLSLSAVLLVLMIVHAWMAVRYW